MRFSQRGLDLGQLDAARLQHHQKVIEQVGGFRGEPVAVLGDGGERHFHRFLAELLGAMADALVQQLAGIGFLRARLGALFDARGEVGQGEGLGQFGLQNVRSSPRRRGPRIRIPAFAGMSGKRRPSE